MDYAIYRIYCFLDRYAGRWELMASMYIPVILNQLI